MVARANDPDSEVINGDGDLRMGSNLGVINTLVVTKMNCLRQHQAEELFFGLIGPFAIL